MLIDGYLATPLLNNFLVS